MCKYCEIDDIENEAKRNIRKNQRVTIKIVRNVCDENFYYLSVDTNSYKKEVIDIKYCPLCRKEARRVTKKEKEKERQEKIEYIKSIVNKEIKFDNRKEELVLGFIFNILTSNTVMNRYEYSFYGNIDKDETIRLADCINYVGMKLKLKEDKQ